MTTKYYRNCSHWLLVVFIISIPTCGCHRNNEMSNKVSEADIAAIGQTKQLHNHAIVSVNGRDLHVWTNGSLFSPVSSVDLTIAITHIEDINDIDICVVCPTISNTGDTRCYTFDKNALLFDKEHQWYYRRIEGVYQPDHSVPYGLSLGNHFATVRIAVNGVQIDQAVLLKFSVEIDNK